MTSNGYMLGGGDQHLCITKHARFPTLLTLVCLTEITNYYYYYYDLLCRVVRDAAYIVLLPRPTENRLVRLWGSASASERGLRRLRVGRPKYIFISAPRPPSLIYGSTDIKYQSLAELVACESSLPPQVRYRLLPQLLRVEIPSYLCPPPPHFAPCQAHLAR